MDDEKICMGREFSEVGIAICLIASEHNRKALAFDAIGQRWRRSMIDTK